MASGDSGDAFARQGGAPAWNADGWNSASENQSSNNENSDQHAQIPIDPAPPSPGDASDDEDGGEYDPESITITTIPHRLLRMFLPLIPLFRPRSLRRQEVLSLTTPPMKRTMLRHRLPPTNLTL